MNLAAAFYRRQRREEAFDCFYDDVVAMSEEIKIGKPARIDSGSKEHQFSLNDRFEQKELLPQVLRLENTVMKAANGENYDDVLQHLEGSCYAPDLDFSVIVELLYHPCHFCI